MKKDSKKKKSKFSKKIVILCIVFIIIYTIVQVYMNFVTTIEISPTLTTCVYAFFGTELAATAIIRVFDKEDREEEEEKEKERYSEVVDEEFRIDG